MSGKKNVRLPHYQVTAGLIWSNGKILITQRPFNDNFGGLWEFPGGKQKPGETLEQCLVREIFEELNIQIQIDKKFLSITYKYDHFQITLHVFICTLENGIPECREVQDWKWIDLPEIDHYDFTEADQKVIQKISESNHNCDYSTFHHSCNSSIIQKYGYKTEMD